MMLLHLPVQNTLACELCWGTDLWTLDWKISRRPYTVAEEKLFIQAQDSPGAGVLWEKYFPMEPLWFIAC